MLGILHFRKLTKMVAPTNATIRVNPHGYSNRPFRLFASFISTIRVNPHGYSPWQTTHKKSPEAEAPRQVSVIKNYRYKATLMELSLLDISLSAKRRVFSSSSENCDGLPFTILPLSLCASHERDFLK